MNFYKAKKYIFIVAQILLLSIAGGCFGRSKRTSEPAEDVARERQTGAIAREEAAKKAAEEIAKNRLRADIAKIDERGRLEKERIEQRLEQVLKAQKEETKKSDISVLKALPGKIEEAFADKNSFSTSLSRLKSEMTFTTLSTPDRIAIIKSPEYVQLKAALQALEDEGNPDELRQKMADYDVVMAYKMSEEEKEQLAAHDELMKEDEAAQKRYFDAINIVLPQGKQLPMIGQFENRYLENIPDDKSQYPGFFAIANPSRTKSAPLFLLGDYSFVKYVKNESDKELFKKAIELAEKDQEAWQKTVALHNALPEMLKKIVQLRNFDKAGAIAKLDTLEAAKVAYLTSLDALVPK